LIGRFFAIPRNIEPALQEMRSTGFLHRLIPEWKGIDHLIRYDLVHRYTVDEHSLICLYHLEHLQDDPFAYARERHLLWYECKDKEVLRLAVLFHDIGKGRNGDHSTVGARLADGVARRMRLAERERQLLVFLVENHLLMSRTAQHRDLSDPQVTADFSDAIQNLDTLNMLYLLTYVDMRSVSPEAMTEWKNNLLWQLYLSTRDTFIGESLEETGDVPAATGGETSRKEKVTLTLAKEFNPELVQSHLDSLPPSYLLYQSTDQIRRHLTAVRSFERKQPVLQFYPHMDPGCLEFVLVWFDKVGLFNQICTAVMLENFSIMEARLNTRSDGIVVNNIVIADVLNDKKSVSPARQALLQDRLTRVLLSDSAPPKLPKSPVVQDLGRARFETQVKILNDIARRFTVLEIRCADRRGLLQNLTSVLYDRDLSIHFARIITNANQVTDVFYVVDQTGGKITDPEQIDQLRTELQNQIEPVPHHV
jgi:[protein-PII] uridylyltransferase